MWTLSFVWHQARYKNYLSPYNWRPNKSFQPCSWIISLFLCAQTSSIMVYLLKTWWVVIQHFHAFLYCVFTIWNYIWQTTTCHFILPFGFLPYWSCWYNDHFILIHRIQSMLLWTFQNPWHNWPCSLPFRLSPYIQNLTCVSLLLIETSI